MNLYETLGVEEDATREDIRAAYQQLASANHPDRGGSQADMAKINVAYRVLGNVERRRAYDSTHEMPGFELSVEAEAKQLLGKIVNNFVIEDIRISKTGVMGVLNSKLRKSLLNSMADLERRKKKYEKALAQVDSTVRAGSVIASVINGHLDGILRNLENVNHSLVVINFLDGFLEDWDSDGVVVATRQTS